MKILFLTNTFVPPGKPGLPRPWAISRYLCSQGHEVTVIANRRHYLDETIEIGGPPDAPLDVEGIRIIGVETTKNRRASIFARVRNYVAVAWEFWRVGRRLPRPDLMLVGTPPPLIVPFVGLMLRRRHRCPAILEIRDLYPHTAIGMGVIRNPLVVRLWTWAETAIQSCYDHIVAVVPGMTDMIVANGVPREKVTVITNAYDDENDVTAEPTGEVGAFFEENADRFIACYGGNLGFANNIGMMLEAAEILKEDSRFVFAFFGEGQKKHEYLETVEAGGLHNVRFFSNQPRPVISKVFRLASALMHGYIPSPLFDYALPNKIFEYHGAGRPVVFAGEGDVADLVRAAGSGIVTPQGDAPALAEALRTLADDPAKADKMGRAGRAYILSEYRRAVVFEKWDDVLENVIRVKANGGKERRKTE